MTTSIMDLSSTEPQDAAAALGEGWTYAYEHDTETDGERRVLALASKLSSPSHEIIHDSEDGWRVWPAVTGDVLTVEEWDVWRDEIARFSDVAEAVLQGKLGRVWTRKDEARARELERKHRPSWADEGTWDSEGVYWKREMSAGSVFVWQSLSIDASGTVTVLPADITVRANEGLDAADASSTIDGLREARELIAG